MIETGCEQNREEINYDEIFVGSFKEAACEILEADKAEKTARFLLVDLDGTLFSNVMKYPFLSVLTEPSMSKKTEEYFELLVQTFDNRIAIATNRNGREKIFWNSADMLEYVKRFIPKEQIFESMEKQIPLFFPKKVEELADYIAASISENYGGECRHGELNSIEDKSIVAFNRSGFLKHVGKKLYEKYGIKVGIKNYVIKK